MEHLLLKNLSEFKKRQEPEPPKDFEYDKKLGAWISRKNNEFLVKSDDPNVPSMGTKKEDIETGEDRKSE